MGGGAYDVYRVSEAMAAIDLGIATGVLATFLGTDPITVGGTPEQNKLWIGRIAEEGLLVAYGATEPQAGSDLAQLKTKAVPVIEDGMVNGYKITGRKQWISNGGVAEIYTILAMAPAAPPGSSSRRAQKGFTQDKPEDKHGIRASNTAALFLEDVYVDADRLVGSVEGQGLAQAQAVFGYTRLMVAAFGLGGGWAALKRAIPYSQMRIQGGAPLSQKQGYTHKLIVPNAVRLEAARAYIEWTADRMDGGEEDLPTEGAVAKYLATEAGNKAAEDSDPGAGRLRLHQGVHGRRSPSTTCASPPSTGTSEIMEWTIARDRWQLHLKTTGAYYTDWADRLEQRPPEQRHRRCDGGPGHARIGRAPGALPDGPTDAQPACALPPGRADRLCRNRRHLRRTGRAANPPRPAARPDPQKAMARIHAHEAALKVAAEGLRWTIGAGQTDPNLAGADLPSIYGAQAGLIEAMTNRPHEAGSKPCRRHSSPPFPPLPPPQSPQGYAEDAAEEIGV